MDQKSWPAPAADAPKPLIYKAEKDWKKEGLNPPVFPLGWPHVANSFSPGAAAWCAHHVYAWWSGVHLSVRVVVWCAPECTRGGPEGRLSVIV